MSVASDSDLVVDCTGLKIAVLAISVLCTSVQIQRTLRGEIATILEFYSVLEARAEMSSFLHKLLCTNG